MSLLSLKQLEPWGEAIKDGIVAAWPICLGYMAVGVAFGVLAQKVGLGPLEIGLMSVIVYAGSSQFIAISMLADGSTITPIMMATFMVNLRHFLMSSSLSLYLKSVRGGWLALYAYGVTDESFALNLTRFRNDSWDWRRALIVNHATNLTWIGSTIAGGLGGQFIPAGAFGIDYALIAMFICLFAFHVRGSIFIIVAIIAGVSAIGLSLSLPGNSYIIISSIGAATAGVILQRLLFPRRSERKS
jgi:4-azaleucine resistance transporter AzlC